MPASMRRLWASLAEAPSQGMRMRPRFVSPNRKHIRVRPAHLAIAALAALITAGDQADAASRRSIRPVESITSRTAGEPVLAIVSLRNQEITVYDANGWIQR